MKKIFKKLDSILWYPSMFFLCAQLFKFNVTPNKWMWLFWLLILGVESLSYVMITFILKDKK